MDQQTYQLIEGIAISLGTTAEYMWGVLVQQAPVSSATQVAAFVVTGLILSFLTYKFRKVLKSDNLCGADGFLFLGFIILGIVWVIYFALLCSLSEMIIAGFFNPEYWALQTILESVKYAK